MAKQKIHEAPDITFDDLASLVYGHVSVTRTAIHKDEGVIADPFTITYPNGDWRLDGVVLPAQSVVQWVSHGGQILNDAYSGVGKSKTFDEGVAAFAGKYVKLIDGTLSVKGSGVDSFTKECRSIARTLFKKKADADQTKTFMALKSVDQNVLLDAIITDHRAVIEIAAKKVMAVKAATKEIEIDIEI